MEGLWKRNSCLVRLGGRVSYLSSKVFLYIVMNQGSPNSDARGEPMAFITKEMSVSYIMRKYPETRAVFLSFGPACPDCLGATIGNLREGATMHGVDLEKLVAALNRAIERERGG